MALNGKPYNCLITYIIPIYYVWLIIKVHTAVINWYVKTPSEDVDDNILKDAVTQNDIDGFWFSSFLHPCG